MEEYKTLEERERELAAQRRVEQEAREAREQHARSEQQQQLQQQQQQQQLRDEQTLRQRASDVIDVTKALASAGAAATSTSMLQQQQRGILLYFFTPCLFVCLLLYGPLWFLFHAPMPHRNHQTFSIDMKYSPFTISLRPSNKNTKPTPLARPTRLQVQARLRRRRLLNCN